MTWRINELDRDSRGQCKLPDPYWDMCTTSPLTQQTHWDLRLNSRWINAVLNSIIVFLGYGFAMPDKVTGPSCSYAGVICCNSAKSCSIDNPIPGWVPSTTNVPHSEKELIYSGKPGEPQKSYVKKGAVNVT